MVGSGNAIRMAKASQFRSAKEKATAGLTQGRLPAFQATVDVGLPPQPPAVRSSLFRLRF